MSTPLYQEALIEAKKLRDAAAVEAKNAVLEAVSPLIKQMIDKEISGIILEQDEPPPPPADAASADAPPPAPPTPSPDAGSTGPVEATPPAGAESKPPMPGMTPAVSAAAPPIKTPGTDVIGKIDLGPSGEQQIVIPVDALFQKETSPASAATATPEATPAAMETAPTPELPAGPPAETPDASAPPPPPSPEATPESISEIYRAVQKLLREQAAAPAAPATPPADPAAAAPPAPPAGGAAPATPDPAAAAPATAAPAPPAAGAAPATPPATPDPAAAAPAPAAGAPTDLNAAAGATPAPGAPATPAAAPAPPAAGAPATPDATGAAPPPVTPTPTAAGAPAAPAAPAPVTEYKNFKQNLERTEVLIQSLRNKSESGNLMFVKEAYEKHLFSLYNNLLSLKAKNAISPRLFSFNEDRLGLLHENLNVITSYKQNPLVKGKNMKNNSLKELVRALFEGAEGFEDEVGKVDPAGDSEGGSAEHAHKVSGNPKGVKAEAEAAPFRTKQKKEWPGKPSPESLLEQLEEEIGELMAEMGDDTDEGMHEEDEVVLELADEEVMMEARKARARLKALREQAEEKLSLTIDLDGVSGANVQNVNVSLDGEELEVEMDEEEASEEDDSEEDSSDEEVEEVEELVKESRRMISKAVNENKALRGHLSETQLLTARSLYVNKLFVRDELTGTQKRKIVEYLDSARTIAEAKEIYSRLVRVLDAGKKNGAMIKESAQRPVVRYITESVVEPSFDTSRWQILAGMKRNAK